MVQSSLFRGCLVCMMSLALGLTLGILVTSWETSFYRITAVISSTNKEGNHYAGLNSNEFKGQNEQLDPTIDPGFNKQLRAMQKTNKIPKQIFMFWDTGFHGKTEPAAQLSIRSFEFHNPSYKLYPLDTSEAERLSDRKSYIPDSVWDKLSVQAKSDIYRTLLLYHHGGIWADASLFCNVPLDSWLDLEQDDLFTFRRFDNQKEQEQRGIDPWITSWFLAAPPKAPAIQKIMDVITNPFQMYRFTSEYFWWHRIVSELAHEDYRVGVRICNDFPSADPLHCMTKGWVESNPPMMKRCANDRMATIFDAAMKCCKGDQADFEEKWQDICSNRWNCTTHTENYKHWDEVLALYGSSITTLNSTIYNQGFSLQNEAGTIL